MKSKLYTLGVVLTLSVLIVTGCGAGAAKTAKPPTIAPTERPTEIPATNPTEVPAEVPDPTRARDAALVHVIAQYGDQAPASGLIWTEEVITPEGLVGSSSFQYVAGDWVVTVSFPLVASQATIYQVVAINQITGFRWEGEVDAAGQVTELSSSAGSADVDPISGLPVVGWYGYVVGLPDGSQYDDYLVVLPEGTAEVGLDSTDKVIKAEIEALRDKEGPGRHAHFWGTLICDVPDYNGCQLVVSRLRPDGPGPFFDPDLVEGWEGAIYSGPPGPRSGGDDYFVLVGDFNVQYGIEAAITESGERELAVELESLRDTGTVVRVWGELVAGIPDWNGTQIQVNRIEVVEEPSASVPPPPDWPEPDDGMMVYVNEDYGYQLKVPPSATITQMGVMSFPADELPAGMSADEYLAQLQEQYSDKLCVQIHYGLGYIYIAAPDLDYRYAICGRTGVGAGEIIDKTEEVTIGGQTYTADGFEFISTAPDADDTLAYHDETLYVELADGTRIVYGAIPRADATYEDYLMKGKGMLLRILASYGPIQ